MFLTLGVLQPVNQLGFVVFVAVCRLASLAEVNPERSRGQNGRVLFIKCVTLLLYQSSFSTLTRKKSQSFDISQQSG